MIALRLLTMVFPFLRETILGKATMKDAIRYRPKKVVLLVAIMVSFVVNVYLVPKHWTLRSSYAELLTKYQSVDYVFGQNTIFKSQVEAQRLEIEKHLAEVTRLRKIFGCKNDECTDSVSPPLINPESQIAGTQPDKWTDAFKQMQDAEKKRGGFNRPH